MQGVTEQRQEQTQATLRVGVTGHRYVASAGVGADPLRDRVRAVFAFLWQTVVDSAPSGSQPVLVVVSPLAEGADRLIAHEAVANGFPLHCPLPFARAEYERDFSGAASRAEYRDLLARAAVVTELPGSPERREAAYEAVGRIVIDQSDLLVAIWDGEAARGGGGTAHVVRDALDRQVPVIWIAARSPYLIDVLTHPPCADQRGEPLDTLVPRIGARIRRLSAGDAG
ncbi:MAG: hypothetical protein ACR2JW_09435 [Thermomicrobiales bacterium]